jgi:hypothetical protein
VHVYLDSQVKSSHGLLYEDDGENANALSTSEYSITQFDLICNKKAVTLRIDSKGKQSGSKRKMRIILHQIQHRPQSVMLGETILPFLYDENLKTLTLDLVQDNSNFELEVK